MPQIQLRYFDCRSRGQALRFALSAAGVPFEDVRVPVDALEAIRGGDGDFGLFHALPVLDWDGHRIAQTLAIAGYLDAKLASPGLDLGEEARAFRAMVVSAAHLDMQVPYSGLLWMAADSSDAAVAAAARGLLEHLEAKAEQLERVLESAAPGYFGGEDAAVADHFVFESLDRACRVIGPRFAATLERLPKLSALHDALGRSHGPLFAAGRVPEVVTASPSERALRERLPALLG